MTLNINLPYRQSIRLRGYDYRQSGAYFITLCTYNREPLFGEIIRGRMHLNVAGNVVQSFWNEIPSHFSNVLLDQFVVMPDHFHDIVVITDSVGAIHESPVGGVCVNNIRAIRESPLQMAMIDRRNMTIPKIIGRFKMQTAKQINALRNTQGMPLWQRNYWERIIRHDSEYQTIRRYILDNPENWQK